MLNIKTFVFNPFQENTYVVSDDSNEAVVIDCGAFFSEERKELTDYIDKNNLKRITKILILSVVLELDY